MTQTLERFTNDSNFNGTPCGKKNVEHPPMPVQNYLLDDCDKAGEQDPIVSIDVVNGEVITTKFTPNTLEYHELSKQLGAVSINQLSQLVTSFNGNTEAA